MSELDQLSQVSSRPKKELRSRSAKSAAPKTRPLEPDELPAQDTCPRESVLPRFLRVPPGVLEEFVAWAHINMTGLTLVELDYLTNDISAILQSIRPQTLMIIQNMTDGYMDSARQERIKQRSECTGSTVVFVSANSMQSGDIKLWNS